MTENGAYVAGSRLRPMLAAVMAGAYAQQSMEVAGEAEAEPASSSSGLFGEGSSAEMRVATWRKVFALKADSDFAYVFMSYEEASHQAGAEVAAAWKSLRESADEQAALAPAHEAAQAGAAAAQPKSSVRPPLARKRAEPKPPATQASRPKAAAAGIETEVLDEMTGLWIDARVQRPTGELSSGRQAE